MKNTNRLAFALLATGALSTPGARGLPLQAQQVAAPDAIAKPEAQAAVDPQALALLKQMESAYKALSSYSGSVQTEESTGDGVKKSSSGTIQWRKPNRFALKRGDAKSNSMVVSNGTSLFVSLSNDKARYLKRAAPTDSAGAMMAMRQDGQTPLLMFYALNGTSLIEMFEVGQAKGLALTPGGEDTVDGAPVDIVVLSMSDQQGKISYFLTLGRDDHLLRQVKVTGQVGAQAITYTETHSNVQANPTLPASAFAFAPPLGAKPVESLEPLRYDARLKKGAAPIAFTATDTSGKPLSLAQFKGRVVLLDFWATWCGPCVGEVPNIVAAHQKYRAKGFEVVGVSLDQDRKALDAFVKQYKMPWRQVFDGQGWKSRVPGLYGVRSIPFALLIGRDGKIAAMDVRGAALEPAIKAALAKK